MPIFRGQLHRNNKDVKARYIRKRIISYKDGSRKNLTIANMNIKGDLILDEDNEEYFDVIFYDCSFDNFIMKNNTAINNMHFISCSFNNMIIDDSTICDCRFINVVIRNLKLINADIANDTYFLNSAIYNISGSCRVIYSSMIDCDYETITLYDSCIHESEFKITDEYNENYDTRIVNAFLNCKIDNTTFAHCKLDRSYFYKCSANNIEVYDSIFDDSDSMIFESNIRFH